MATGGRRWGRREAASANTAQRPGAHAGRTREGGHGALTSASDLARLAAWGGLAGAARTALLAPYAALAAPQLVAAPAPSDRLEDVEAQAWVSDLVAPYLQAPAVSAVRTWLADSAPSAHMYVLGASGRGRTSVVATLARRAMATRPAPPDYCYVPDPAAPSHYWVLALPTGTGSAFAETLGSAMRQMLVSWEKPRERARAADDDEADDATLRARLIERAMAAITDEVPDVARPYLDRLTAGLVALSGVPTTPGVAEVEAPAGRIPVPVAQVAGSTSDAPAPGTDQNGAGFHAPVIAGSLARMSLNGALLRANGGVLILLAADFVDRDQLTGEWAQLRAILQAGALHLHGTGEPAIPITTRVALVGAAPFRVLERAEGFLRLFRYKVRFEDDTAWTPEAEAVYAAFGDGVARRFALPPFDAGGSARLIEEGGRRAFRQQRARLTTDLLALRDLAIEAGRHAQAAAIPGSDASAATSAATLAGIVTTTADVEAVLARRTTEQRSHARAVRDEILAGRELIPTSGSAVGEINGLGVTSYLLPYEARFGIPQRISVAVSPGREELIDIEHEAGVADSDHVSAALTMAGYLAWRYGRQRPVSVVVRLRAEQQSEVGGPSSSAAETFALLSALANVPIRRSLAVTGVVGQHGEVQLIGGVNEKIEGFWEICRARRAQGERPDGVYGVLIPVANAQDLMLRREVVAAIAEEGWFHVWPIQSIDDGLPILTGVSARDIHTRVERQLQRYNEIALRDLPR